MFTEAELLAGWERVRDNNGCAGVDAVTWSALAAVRIRG